MDCVMLFTVNLYKLILYKPVNTTSCDAVSTLVQRWLTTFFCQLLFAWLYSRTDKWHKTGEERHEQFQLMQYLRWEFFFIFQRFDLSLSVENKKIIVNYQVEKEVPNQSFRNKDCFKIMLIQSILESQTI